MDPVSIAAAAVAALSPYLVKAGEKAAGAAGETIASTVWATSTRSAMPTRSSSRGKPPRAFRP
ncbi:MAG: hypothetical protein JWL63_3452 [Rhodocyclales bacterium]|nr:hypothetical protein [Rhodocyclales bacterium]